MLLFAGCVCCGQLLVAATVDGGAAGVYFLSASQLMWLAIVTTDLQYPEASTAGHITGDQNQKHTAAKTRATIRHCNGSLACSDQTMKQ